MNKRKNIWIIGASDGIGRACAIALASQGHRLALSARNLEQLRSLKNTLLIPKDSNHLIVPLDVADPAAITHAIQTIDETWSGQLDQVLFFAGIYETTSIGQMDTNYIQQCINVNLTGAILTCEHVIALWQKNQSTQNINKCLRGIAICASISGYIGLPHAQPYAATKAALINYSESLYAEHGHQYRIQLINPGFVATRLTAKNTFKMPGILSVEQAAEYILEGLNSSKFRIEFPWMMTLVLKTLKILPDTICLPILRRLKKKPKKQ